MGSTLNTRTCSRLGVAWGRDLGHVRRVIGPRSGRGCFEAGGRRPCYRWSSRCRSGVKGGLCCGALWSLGFGVGSPPRRWPWLRFRGSPPTLGSIVSRSRTASRTGFARRLRRSPSAILDPVRDREKLGLYRVGGGSLAQRIQLGAGLGAVGWSCAGGLCFVGAFGSGRDLVNGSQAGPCSWLGRVRCRWGREFPTDRESSPTGVEVPHAPECGERSLRWGRVLAGGERRRGVEQGWPERSFGRQDGRL